MRRFLVGIGVLVGLLLYFPEAHGQPINPPTGGGPNQPQAVPLTGLEYLLLGGGAYGVSRLLKNRRKKNNES